MTLRIKAYLALAATLYYLGNFESALQYTMRGAQLWRSGGVKSQAEEVDPPAIGCLCHEALIQWHFGEIASCHASMAEAISLAKELNDIPGLAVALNYAAFLGYFERNPAQVERLASDLIELSTRHNFAHWLAMGAVFRGWARSASGDTQQGISWIEDGIENLRANGSVLGVLCLLALKAEALHLANRTSEALEVIDEAKRWSKDPKGGGGAPNCTGFAVYFSRLLVRTRPKLRLYSTMPSESHGSRSRFR
jgi:tetratricopeptide (TPR) repeat protein